MDINHHMLDHSIYFNFKYDINISHHKLNLILDKHNHLHSYLYKLNQNNIKDNLVNKYYFLLYIFHLLDMLLHIYLEFLILLYLDNYLNMNPYILFYLVINNISIIIYILEDCLTFNNKNIILYIYQKQYLLRKISNYLSINMDMMLNKIILLKVLHNFHHK